MRRLLRKFAGLTPAATVCWIAVALSQTPAAADTGLASPYEFAASVSTPQPSDGPTLSTAVPQGSLFESAQGTYGLKPNGGIVDLRPACDGCPTHGVVALVGYDAFRGVADDSWENNGIHAGLNYGTRLGQFSEWTGIGFQIGGTVGVYDWAGTDYRPDPAQAQTQSFVTYGFFRKATEGSRWSAAAVQDWMINNNFGVFGQSPIISQWRGQLGYAVNAWNEFGVWGAWHSLSDSRNVNGVGPTTWRAENQINPYWRHKWGVGGVETSIWVGVPERNRLGAAGSLGDYIAGAAANAPLSDRVGLYTLVTYMHPSARPGVGSEEEAWNFTIGLAFYPARNARSTTVAGQCWMPQLPVANNGYFMVDTNRH
jgi:hypothetical protein